jgi:hypothetical protein
VTMVAFNLSRKFVKFILLIPRLLSDSKIIGVATRHISAPLRTWRKLIMSEQ